jgi:hypothetical protein
MALEPDVLTFGAQLVPAGVRVDGAVAELTQEPDGTITAQIRINGPVVP